MSSKLNLSRINSDHKYSILQMIEFVFEQFSFVLIT